MNMCPTNLAEGLVASLSPLAASNVFNFDPSSNTWFHGPTRVSSPNGIWMRPNNLKIVIDETEIYDWLCWVSSRTMLVVHPVNIFAHYQFVVCDEPCRHHWLSFAGRSPTEYFRSLSIRRLWWAVSSSLIVFCTRLSIVGDGTFSWFSVDAA